MARLLFPGGDFSIALIVCLFFSVVNRSVVPVSAERTVIIVVALAIFIANMRSLRRELRTHMGSSNESEKG